jgi:hypothetical protein
LVAFTIYPPGYTPYGRQPILPLAPDGTPLQSSDTNDKFDSSLIQASVDAANNKLWSSEATDGHTQYRYTSQRRYLNQAASLLGISPSTTDETRNFLASILEVPGQVLHDYSFAIEKDSGSVNLGTSILQVLDTIPSTKDLYLKLTIAGAYVSLWPYPVVFQNTGQIEHFPVFQESRTRGSPQ